MKELFNAMDAWSPTSMNMFTNNPHLTVLGIILLLGVVAVFVALRFAAKDISSTLQDMHVDGLIEADCAAAVSAVSSKNNWGEIPEEMLRSKALSELIRALEVCHESLRTYGPHPIIDNQVHRVLNKVNGHVPVNSTIQAEAAKERSSTNTQQNYARLSGSADFTLRGGDDGIKK